MAWTETILEKPCTKCGYTRELDIKWEMCRECRLCCRYQDCYFDKTDICYCCREKK